MKAILNSISRNYLRKRELTFRYSFLNIYKYNFCNKISIDDFNILKNFNKEEEFNNFYAENKNYIDTNLELSLLFLEHFSDYNYNLSYEKKLNKNIENIPIDLLFFNLEKDLLNLDAIYVLSLLESLYKLNYYSQNKIWIKIQYIILKTDFVKNIELEYHFIILKAFQNFFNISETTVSVEEIFEAIEYHTILKLKQIKKYNLDENTMANIIELYVLFCKNLEGSEELYSLMIDKILLQNTQNIFMFNPELLVNIYFSTNMLHISTKKTKKFIFNRNKNDKLNDLLRSIEKLINEKIADNKINTMFKTYLNNNPAIFELLKYTIDKREIRINI